MKEIKINWPNGKSSNCSPGDEWLNAAFEANVEIPTGCLGGSCGACEIEINGKVIRSCDSTIDSKLLIKNEVIKVDFYNDPYW